MTKAEQVDKREYVKENVRVEGFDGKAKVIPLAKVWIDISDLKIQAKSCRAGELSSWHVVRCKCTTCILDALLDFERSTRTPKICVYGKVKELATGTW